jgi:molybdopterin converting factor small subunit
MSVPILQKESIIWITGLILANVALFYVFVYNNNACNQSNWDERASNIILPEIYKDRDPQDVIQELYNELQSTKKQLENNKNKNATNIHIGGSVSYNKEKTKRKLLKGDKVTLIRVYCLTLITTFCCLTLIRTNYLTLITPFTLGGCTHRL